MKHQRMQHRFEILAHAPVPTAFGLFDMIVFRSGKPDEDSGLSPDHMALIMGDVRGGSSVFVRVHSECLTSEVFGSLKCDCNEQLQAAQREIARRGVGIILYMRQEGRGIGLANKIRAYALQARGHDTVDANRLLGLPDDARDYAPAVQMLEHLGVGSIELMTNNPLKVNALRELGIRVERRAPAVVGLNALSGAYLETKRMRMGHTVAPVNLGELSGSGESCNHKASAGPISANVIQLSHDLSAPRERA
ncbi:MAG TPA: GTP cyclohydrolase II [Polyangium sp.]|nr:GTP cyclohydrolase II [Polyangium sp.]